jgi:hypothetical protein
MDRQVLPLYRQFCGANGIMDPENDNLHRYVEFFDWLQEMQHELGPKYLEFLDFLGLNYRNSNATAEVGKGYFDSIAMINSPDTYIISPEKGFENTPGMNNRVIVCNFKVREETPMLISGGKSIKLMPGHPFSNFMIQNPYVSTELSGWDLLHNSGNYGIIAGVYGKNYDHDREEKVDDIRTLADKLDSHIVCDYITDNDNYYCAVGTNHKKLVKYLVKTRTRQK